VLLVATIRLKATPDAGVVTALPQATMTCDVHGDAIDRNMITANFARDPNHIRWDNVVWFSIMNHGINITSGVHDSRILIDALDHDRFGGKLMSQKGYLAL